MTNHERRQWGRNCVERHASDAYCHTLDKIEREALNVAAADRAETELTEVVKDSLTNILHYADHMGLNVGDLIASATQTMLVEVADERASQ